MPRKPKPKNTLSAGERVALFEAEQQEKQKKLEALNAISGILTTEESNAINDSISAGIKCKEIQL